MRAMENRQNQCDRWSRVRFPTLTAGDSESRRQFPTDQMIDKIQVQLLNSQRDDPQNSIGMGPSDFDIQHIGG